MNRDPMEVDPMHVDSMGGDPMDGETRASAVGGASVAEGGRAPALEAGGASAPEAGGASVPEAAGASETETPEAAEDNYAPRTYAVRHVTTYDYAAPRDAAYERSRMTPRGTPSQVVRRTETIVEPEPDLVSETRDVYGNPSFYIEVQSPHTRLRVTKRSIVDVAWPKPDLQQLDRYTVAEVAALARARGGSIDPVEAVEFLLPSPLVEVSEPVAAYADRYLAPERPFGEAVLALTRGIFADFTYRNGVTNVRTTLTELLELGAGVCQDFAQLAIGCLRHAGLPARYVSGYIETRPAPGTVKLEGSDASHAWASVLGPDGEWIDLDPTNDHFADSRYVVSAWGRDFTDVSPLRGIVYGDATESTLDVGVDVIRLDEERVAPWERAEAGGAGPEEAGANEAGPEELVPTTPEQ